MVGTARAMATEVSVHTLDAGVPGQEVAAGRALEIFREVESACTRFDPGSPLARLNARPARWHSVPPLLYQAVRAAHQAYQTSKGRFDPRVHRDLVGLGYDRSLAFAEGSVETPGGPPTRRPAGPWRPRFRGGPRPQLHSGGAALDLGGIGKGLAIRWASKRLEEEVDEHVIAAGGDVTCRGRGPEGDGWRVAIEDPRGGTDPVAVVALSDRACATSSIRVRRWRCDGRRVHHLIDPRSGRPGGAGLLAVTVVAPDPVEAEVLSKSLFLEGSSAIAHRARRAGVAAFWVAADGRTGETVAFSEHVVWRSA